MKPTSDSAALEKRPAHTAAHNGAGRESPAALVAGIERTRDDLARTIDAIADRVSPANIARRTAGRARERVAQIDPVVAGGAVLAVTAVAVTFLLLRRRKRRLSPASPRPPQAAVSRLTSSGARTRPRTGGLRGARPRRAGAP